MKTASETTPLIMATTLTISRKPEYKTPFSASSVARIGLDADSGLLTRSLGGATSRGAWKAKSMPYKIMGRCLLATMSIMHPVPGNAPLW